MNKSGACNNIAVFVRRDGRIIPILLIREGRYFLLETQEGTHKFLTPHEKNRNLQSILPIRQQEVELKKKNDGEGERICAASGTSQTTQATMARGVGLLLPTNKGLV